MPTKKYEIKSNDLQELMSKVPHLFIVWGNFFVFIFLFTSLSMLNGFTIYEKKSIPVRIVEISKNGTSADSLRMVLSTHDTKKINISQPIDLHVELEGNKPISGRIIKISRNKYYESLLNIVVKKPGHAIETGMIGNAEIVIQETSFISDLINNSF